MRQSVVPAVAGALADLHKSAQPPAGPKIDDTLRRALGRLDHDARTGAPWTGKAGPSTALLAYFDSQSRVLRVVNTGAGRVFLGRRVGGRYECEEVGAPGSVNHLELVQFRRVDVEELAKGVSHPIHIPDMSGVRVQSIEIRDGDFLVLGSCSTWESMEGDDAVQAVNAWIQEQKSVSYSPQDRRWPQDPIFGKLKFRWDKEDLGFGTSRAMVPDLLRDIDGFFSLFSGQTGIWDPRANSASHVLQRSSGYEGKHGPDGQHVVQSRPLSSNSAHGGSVMVVMFSDAQPQRPPFPEDAA
ncbi:hypothetical protein BC834DRAFT_426746 [Gloeopeniophorella convolvens]|nr:hypothetical protein BC834DRAFT_426746 [Gloeopeniophorella convolvens]